MDMEELEEFVLAEDAPVAAADELEDLFGVIDDSINDE